MIDLIVRLVPIVIFSFGLYQGSSMMARVFGNSKKSAVRIEMNQIKKVIEMEAMSGHVVKPEEFSDFLRSFMKTTDKRPDPSLDQWGQAYYLEKNVDTSWRIGSKGADKVVGTKDDIVLEVNLSYGAE